MRVDESPTLADLRSYFPRCNDWRFADIILSIEYAGLKPRVVIGADWCWQRNVLLLSDPRFPEYVQYSYDDSACNCMPWRNGRDAADGAADSLPHYREDVETLQELLEHLRASEIYVQVGTTLSGWTARIFRANNWSDSSTAASWCEAVVRALLLDHQRKLQEVVNG